MTSRTDATPFDVSDDDADAQMKAIEDSILDTTKILNDNEQPKRLTMQLIRQSLGLSLKHSTKRILSLEDEEEEYEETNDDEEQEINSLLQKKTLRLDWMTIGRMENLEAFTHIEELYLQHNCIESIENLQDHQALTFLALGDNRISKVENLRTLTNLKFLDLSNNQIEDFDINEFPSSLVILRLAGNPFIRHMPAYMHLFFQRLPHLVQIDQYRRGSDHEISSPLSFSPRSSYLEFEMEVESLNQLPFEKKNKESFNLNEYEKEKKERMKKWKEQIKELELRQATYEKQDIPVITRTTSGATIRTRPKLILERAREGTKTAIAESISHFQQMELEHKTWQDRQQQAA